MKYILSLFLAVTCSAQIYFTPISKYPNNPSPTNGILLLLTVPGKTNQNITIGQFLTFLGTNLSVGNGGTYQAAVITNQSSFVLDFAVAQTYGLFYLDTNNITTSFALTNLSYSTNNANNFNIIVHNLSVSNFFYSFPSNISWVSQASNTNTLQPSNCLSGVVQQIQLFSQPAFGTNNAIIGSVNP